MICPTFQALFQVRFLLLEGGTWESVARDWSQDSPSSYGQIQHFSWVNHGLIMVNPQFLNGNFQVRRLIYWLLTRGSQVIVTAVGFGLPDSPPFESRPFQSGGGIQIPRWST